MATEYKIPQPASDNKLAIKLENVSVEYDLPSDRINSIKEYLIRLAQHKVHKKQFYALHDIDLEIYAGEIFGILGKNGAGKSTLMKVISRVLIPVQGKVWIAGVCIHYYSLVRDSILN